METSRSPHQQAFPRKPPLIRILDIRVTLLIYMYKWWDGWPPNSRFKYLFSQPFHPSVSADAPTGAPSKGWLLPDAVGHQVTNLGSRFSKNARTPSTHSRDSSVISCAARSARSCCSRELSNVDACSDRICERTAEGPEASRLGSFHREATSGCVEGLRESQRA